MKKERHIKTFPEKFGHQDIEDKAKQFISDNLTRDNYNPEDVFNRMPYVGYMRIDSNDRDFYDWWYCTEEDILRAKVVRVDNGEVYYYHYDNHHHEICYRKQEYEGFAVQGNALIKLDKIDNHC